MVKATIQLSGIIKFEYSDWDKIKLVQEDGYKIDLVGRFIEATESFPNQKIQVNYWLSDTPKTKEEMIGGVLTQHYGNLSANYDKTEFSYSSYTSGTDYDTNLKVGGHDIYRELREQQGKYIVIELNFFENDNIKKSK